MARTLIRIFLDTVAAHHKPAQFMRKHGGRWEEISADRALEDVECLALGLRHVGVQRGDRVAILSENRYEWAISDLAIMGLGGVSVPVYATLTPAQCRHILLDCEAAAAIVSTPAQLEKLHSIAGELPALKTIVHMDPVPVAGPRDKSWELVTGRGALVRHNEPLMFRSDAHLVRPGDLATIIYTSGTTGDPKGAMLTHANIASNVDACLQVITMFPSDVCLSFLPLSHIFERMAGLYAMLAGGVTIAYAESMETVAADAVQVRPTVLGGVPRFFEKVYARVMENVLTQPSYRRRLFFWGLQQGLERARLRFAGRTPSTGLALRAAIADRLVGSKVRARVGGRLRFCISGGAPLAPKVMEFFFAVGIPVVEGYGLTETSPVICLNQLGHEKPGSVGPPIPGVEVSIAADGEILCRGPNVMQGYFHNPEATAAALAGGWFHTGDVGHFDDGGCLVITDRLKDLLVTAGGKKVAPQPIEASLKSSKWISEAVLLGDRQPYIACLIVPNFVNLLAEAKAHGWPADPPEALFERAEVQALYQREVDRVNTDRAPFECIKRFALLDRDLSQDAGELTPTLKVKRRVIAERFAKRIETLYPPRPEAATA